MTLSLSEQIYTWLADNYAVITPGQYYRLRQWGEAAEALEAENEKLKEFARKCLPDPQTHRYTERAKERVLECIRDMSKGDW